MKNRSRSPSRSTFSSRIHLVPAQVVLLILAQHLFIRAWEKVICGVRVGIPRFDTSQIGRRIVALALRLGVPSRSGAPVNCSSSRSELSSISVPFRASNQSSCAQHRFRPFPCEQWRGFWAKFSTIWLFHMIWVPFSDGSLSQCLRMPFSSGFRRSLIFVFIVRIQQLSINVFHSCIVEVLVGQVVRRVVNHCSLPMLPPPRHRVVRSCQ